jgi:serine/threonine-protein kinase
MKLVEGRTLADLLRQRADPAEEQGRFLTIFEQVCQTLAYAHSNGVIHRDLKPGNVMVGAFGEVQVMDWGLAKALARTEEEGDPPSSLVPHPSCHPETQPGAVLGTYAYMAPEQARGEVERLDERCDVFGLGALLCEILTGRPPFRGASGPELADRARRCDHAEALAALESGGADAELGDLAKACLASEPSARPANAGAVAAALAAHLAGVQQRLRRAELERAAAEARAVAERRRRWAQLAAAAAVLALVVVGAGGGLWAQRLAAERREQQARHEAEQFAEQARRDAEQRQLVESAVEKATALRERQRFREAKTMLEQGWQALGNGGPDDLRQRLDVAEAQLKLVKRLDDIRQRRATVIDGKFDMRTASRDYAAAFKEAGLGEVSDDEEVVAERVCASGVAGPLVAALDDWASVAEDPKLWMWLLGVTRRAAPDAWGVRFRDPAVWRDRQALRALADDALRDGGAKLGELSPQAVELLGILLGGGAEAVPLLRAAQRRYPGDFWLNLDLGNALHNANMAEEAMGYYRAAVALRPDAGAAHNNLGNALYAINDLDEAIAEYRTAIALDSQYAIAHANLGNALSKKGDLDEAIAEYRTAIDLKHTGAHSNLGVALRDKGDLDGSIAEYQKAIDFDPNDSTAHYNLGFALRAKKDLDGAIAANRRALAIDPDYAEAHCNLGIALREQGQFAEALEELRRGHALGIQRRGWPYPSADWVRQCERLIALDHKLLTFLRVEAEPADAAERIALAQLCQYKRRHAAAVGFYADAFAADPPLAADLGQQHRYKAACNAALAATGHGDDARQLPDRVVVMLRRRALGWLGADLALYAQAAEGANTGIKRAVQQRLTQWQHDADLASVCDGAALDQLPEDERRQWRQLWDDVAALLARVGAMK